MQVFYESIFLKTKGVLIAQPPPLLHHQLSPLPPYSVVGNQHVVTSPLPYRLPAPAALGGPEGAGPAAPPLCGAQSAEGRQHHGPAGPFPIPRRLKCNATPLLRQGQPCHPHSQAVRPSGPGKQPASSFPVTLGDQMYLMVKGLIPGLTARASERA